MIKKASDETDNVLCEYTEDEKSTITHIGFRTIPGAAPRFQECHPGYFPQYLNESIEADDGIYWVPTSGRDEQVVRINKDQIVYDSNMQRSVIRQDTVNNKLKDNRMSNFKSKTKKASDDEMELLLDGSRGVYIPKNFVECYSPEEWHLSPEIAEILAKDPEGNDYWEAWDEVLNTAFYEKDGKKYTLYQGESGDLFAVPEGYDWDHQASARSKTKSAKREILYLNSRTAALTVGSDFDCTEDAAKKIASEIGQLDNVERYHMSGDKLVFYFAKEIK